MFTKLAIWYLRKRKKSVLIGWDVEDARMQCKHSDSFVFGNTLTDCEFYTKNGNDFPIYSTRKTVVIKGFK